MNSIKRTRIALASLFVGVVVLVITSAGSYRALDEGITRGRSETAVESARMSWMVASECGKGDAACDAALETANANEWGIRFYEDGTASRN